MLTKYIIPYKKAFVKSFFEIFCERLIMSVNVGELARGGGRRASCL